MEENVKPQVCAHSMGEHTPTLAPHLPEAHEHNKHGEVIGSDPSSLGAAGHVREHIVKKCGEMLNSQSVHTE